MTISGGALNANSMNLNVGGHWTNNGAFTPGAGTVTFNGTVAQNLGGTSATTFNNLTLNNANGLSLSGSTDATVNGLLTFTSGVLSTGSNKLIVSATGSVARTSGHVFGNLQKNVATGAPVSRTSDIGDAAAANYTPATVAFASVSTPGNLTARAVSGDHPQIGSAHPMRPKASTATGRSPTVARPSSPARRRVQFLTADLDPSTSTTSLICGKYDAPNWTYPTIGTRTANSTEITGLRPSAISNSQRPPVSTRMFPPLTHRSIRLVRVSRSI
ncbi:MAG: hypothetical protein IPH04_10760 [Saprospirales bacterium]|nr:hypothetical protein [Saprospirales bacterium]